MESFGREWIPALPLLASVVLALPSPGLTQDVLRENTVANRNREDLDPQGAVLGGFRMFPSLSLAAVSNDNIFATNEDRLSDDVYELNPRIDFRSDWSRNALNASVESSINRYSSFSSENHTNTAASLGGRWDTARNGFFFGEYERGTSHEDRASPDDAGGDTPIKFDRDELVLNYRLRPGRMFAQAGVTLRSLDYVDVARGDEIINNDDRDRDTFRGLFRVGYELSDSYGIFLQRIQSSITYVGDRDDFGFNRNGSGHETVLGATFNVSELLFGDIFFGTKSQEYHDPRFEKIGGSAYGADLAWNITQLTTLNFFASREVEPTTLIGSAGVDTSRFSIGADHELLRNLILSLEWGNTDEDFKGIDRNDESSSLVFSARYLMNRRMEVRFSYIDQERSSSTEADLEYARRRIGIEIVGQL
jgi:hypothetical protein